MSAANRFARPAAWLAERGAVRLRVRALSAAIAAACAIASSGWAVAGPAEDHKAGEQAYQRGDMVTAMTSLRKSADVGHAPSQVLLAYILDQASFDEEAVAWYRKAADQGSVDGEFGLAGMYAQGEGVPKDSARARALYEQAAARGHQPSLRVLAAAYANGGLGLAAGSRDDAKAVATLRRAAESDFEPAILALARAYRSGDFGLAPDAAEAARWEARSRGLAKPVARAPTKGGTATR